MKVPFLKGRINNEFKIFLDELKLSVDSNISAATATKNTEMFDAAYPLFALLRCLSSSKYARNPVKEIVLNEIRKSGDKPRFLDAAQHFNSSKIYDNELNRGLQKQAFTGFFNELFSDALLLVNSYYTANYRGSSIAIRCMCEDLYRHLYYFDHPQEYYSISKENPLSERELGLSPAKFREALPRLKYLEIFSTLADDFLPKSSKLSKASIAPASGGANSPLMPTSAIFDLFSLNERLYAETSSAVHGSAADSHNAFRANADLKFNKLRSDRVIKSTREFVHMAIAFLIATHMDYVTAFDEYEKSIVMSGYSPTERGALRRALNL